MTVKAKIKRGPKPIDSLISKLEKLKKNSELELENENQRNRALRWARYNRCFFITRTYPNKKIILRRVS